MPSGESIETKVKFECLGPYELWRFFSYMKMHSAFSAFHLLGSYTSRLYYYVREMFDCVSCGTLNATHSLYFDCTTTLHQANVPENRSNNIQRPTESLPYVKRVTHNMSNKKTVFIPNNISLVTLQIHFANFQTYFTAIMWNK